MKGFIFALFLVLAICYSQQLSAEITTFNHPSIISFEQGVSPAICDVNSEISISREHYKHASNSLQWKWSSGTSWLSIRQDIGYKPANPGNKNNLISTFVYWVYSKSPEKQRKIKVEFLKDGRVCCFFEYGLNFTGWRGAWIAFDRDMQGKPETGMDEMRMSVPGCDSGELLFDHVMLSSEQDVRHHTADFQAPYVNPDTKSHWLVLLSSWNKEFDLPLTGTLSPSQINSIKTVGERLQNMLLEGKKDVPVKNLLAAAGEYAIRENKDGTLSGLPVFFERYGETYEYLGAENYKKLYANAMGISECNKLMFNMAVSFHKNQSFADKEIIANAYVKLMKHLLDQGFQAGSAMGTLHHLGYSMRNFYTAAFLMRKPLLDAGMLQDVQKAMEWFAGTGEVKTVPKAPGMDIDAFNTSLIARLSGILMLHDSPEKVRYLTAFKRWIDNGFLHTPGTGHGFKIDGSIYHHRHNYPAYAVGGLDGAVAANVLFAGTDFQLNASGREVLKNALLAMRFYCNLQNWPLSLSGRHPDGKGSLIPNHFAMLASTGSPDYTQKTDKELAEAYLRLESRPQTKYARQFREAGFKAEIAPEGNRSFGYSCLNVHRQGNWMVSAMGFSRYLWATETYPGANMFGRYLNHGNLQILASGNPVSNAGSGFNQQGWDWNHFPGTTAAVLPLQELRADVKNTDADSGYEEMLLSDEAFAGSLSHLNKQGVFAMKLHENAKYNGSLYARKTYFFFDNRIVALGSGIRSALPGKQVHTTMFQVYMPESNFPLNVNGDEISTFPFEKQLNGRNYISDGLNNYFFVAKGDIQVKKSLQHSFDEETEEPTKNRFARASINHGETPENESYEYLVLVQPEKTEVQKMVRSFQPSGKMTYKVLQHDTVAHIVKDLISGTTAYALFNAGKVNAKQDIRFVSMPCLIMTSSPKAGKMTLSVSDPDLRLYEGMADVVYDNQGKPVERSVYSMSWIDNESKPSQIEIQVSGKWKSVEKSPFYTIKSYEKNTTIITLSCQHALTREIKLKRF